MLSRRCGLGGLVWRPSLLRVEPDKVSGPLHRFALRGVSPALGYRTRTRVGRIHDHKPSAPFLDTVSTYRHVVRSPTPPLPERRAPSPTPAPATRARTGRRGGSDPPSRAHSRGRSAPGSRTAGRTPGSRAGSRTRGAPRRGRLPDAHGPASP